MARTFRLVFCDIGVSSVNASSGNGLALSPPQA